jgi:hypothetical protein
MVCHMMRIQQQHPIQLFFESAAITVSYLSDFK